MSQPLTAEHTLLRQAPLVQSESALQVLPFTHCIGQAPPQSMSPSPLFLMPSVQVGAWQTNMEQAPPVVAAQSALVTHCTHVPEPLQTAPLIWLQGAPAMLGGLLGTPAVQTSSVH